MKLLFLFTLLLTFDSLDKLVSFSFFLAAFFTHCTSASFDSHVPVTQATLMLILACIDDFFILLIYSLARSLTRLLHLLSCSGTMKAVLMNRRNKCAGLLSRLLLLLLRNHLLLLFFSSSSISLFFFLLLSIWSAASPPHHIEYMHPSKYTPAALIDDGIVHASLFNLRWD